MVDRKIVDDIANIIANPPELPSLGEKQEDPNELLWVDLVKKSQSGEELSPQERRTLDIRQAVLSATTAWHELVHNPELASNAIEKSEIIDMAKAELEKLRELGIVPKVHEGKGADFVSTPERMAEWMAGQLLEIDRTVSVIPSEADVRPIVEELTLRKVTPLKLDGKTGNDAHITDNALRTPTTDNYVMISDSVGLARKFLAFNLDGPQPVPQPKQK